MFQSAIHAAPWVWSPANYCLIVTDPCMSGTAALLATRARQSRGDPYVECAHPVALARQLENGGRGHSHWLQ